jgi:hypothetical protein
MEFIQITRNFLLLARHTPEALTFPSRSRSFQCLRISYLPFFWGVKPITVSRNRPLFLTRTHTHTYCSTAYGSKSIENSLKLYDQVIVRQVECFI